MADKMEGKSLVTITIPGGDMVYIKSIGDFGAFDTTNVKSEALRMDGNEMTQRVAILRQAMELAGDKTEISWVYV